MAGFFSRTNDYSEFPWMKFAVQEYGQKEIVGKKSHNPRILLYHSVSGKAKDDETPWCSSFVNWCMKQAGIKGTGRPNARSWLGWDGICLANPIFGAVTIFSRPPKPWHGHVAFYVGQGPNGIVVLGGNQGNSVSLGTYPRTRLLGYRWPATLPVAASVEAKEIFATVPTIMQDLRTLT